MEYNIQERWWSGDNLIKVIDDHCDWSEAVQTTSGEIEDKIRAKQIQ